MAQCYTMNSCNGNNFIEWKAMVKTQSPPDIGWGYGCVRQPPKACNVQNATNPGHCQCSCGGHTTANENDVSCSDDVDNDCDGLVDCADPDCSSEISCFEDNCANNVDDDGDNYADCRDDDCYNIASPSYCGGSTMSGAAKYEDDGNFSCSNMLPNGTAIPISQRHCCPWGQYWDTTQIPNRCRGPTQCYPTGGCPYLPSNPFYWLDIDCIPGIYGGLSCCPIVLGGGSPIYASQPFIIY
jgi:hypothetical protein